MNLIKKIFDNNNDSRYNKKRSTHISIKFANANNVMINMFYKDISMKLYELINNIFFRNNYEYGSHIQIFHDGKVVNPQLEEVEL
ncbi:hypothetical protein SH2C18_18820 [Clostridium sediminicola]